ncbi:MAG: beta-phosphoglucomutase [Proteobacteria bacterium]|nr:beta-phosphoglucomutase [Pseudomonadota bacterium]
MIQQHPAPSAFIFDLDGVITDTAELHYVAWRALALDLGIVFDEADNEQLKGLSRMDSLERILALGTKQFSEVDKHAMAERKNAHYLALVEKMTPADLLPGALDALGAARAAGCGVALASASKNAALVLERLGISQAFDHVVDSNHIRNSKPHPEVFLAAAKALGAAPQDCVGIEDAVAGVQAIRAAGMFAVGVGDARVLAQADQVIADLRHFIPSNYLRGQHRLRWVNGA